MERTIGEGTWDLLSSKEFPKVSTDTWRSVQGRASALFPDDLFAALNDYYSPLQTLLTLVTFEHRGAQRLLRDLKRRYVELTGEEVPASRNPWDEYLKVVQDNRVRARARVVTYLALKWDDRLIQRLRRWVARRWQRDPRAEP